MLHTSATGKFLRALSSATLVATATGCGDSETDAKLDAAQSQIDRELSAVASLNITRILWDDYLVLRQEADPAIGQAAREKFVKERDDGLALLLSILEDPDVSPDQKLLAVEVLEEMLPGAERDSLSITAANRLSDLRDALLDDESKAAVTPVLLIALNEAIAADPQQPSLWFLRADEHFESGRTDQALADIDEALALKPAFPNAHYLRGVIRRSQGMHEEAIADYTAALDADPTYADIYLMRAASWMAVGQLDKAVDDLTAAIEAKPEWARAYAMRATAYEKLGRQTEADADRAEAARLTPSN